MIRILLADDHNLFRQGVRRILENQSGLAVIAEASSGLQAVEMAKEHQPDVAIVDIAMGELNGIEATSQLLRHSPQTAVLILSMYGDSGRVSRALAKGAKGYVTKNDDPAAILTAIDKVLESAEVEEVTPEEKKE